MTEPHPQRETGRSKHGDNCKPLCVPQCGTEVLIDASLGQPMEPHVLAAAPSQSHSSNGQTCGQDNADGERGHCDPHRPETFGTASRVSHHWNASQDV